MPASGEVVAAAPMAGQKAGHMNAHTNTKTATRESVENRGRLTILAGHDTSILTFPARAGACIDIGYWWQSSHNLPWACRAYSAPPAAGRSACMYYGQWQLEKRVDIARRVVSRKMAFSPITTAGCWLRGSCSPRWNGCLAGLGMMAVRQNGWSWDIVNFHH